jgi:hypothetical protein
MMFEGKPSVWSRDEKCSGNATQLADEYPLIRSTANMFHDGIAEHDIKLAVTERQRFHGPDLPVPQAGISVNQVRPVFSSHARDVVGIRVELFKVVRLLVLFIARHADIKHPRFGTRAHRGHEQPEHFLPDVIGDARREGDRVGIAIVNGQHSLSGCSS